MKRISVFLAFIFLCAMIFHVEVEHSQSSGFNDDFNDNARDTSKWAIATLHDNRFSSQVQVAEQSQQLRITTPVGVTGYGGYVTASSWNFTNASTSIEVVQTVGSSNDMVFALGLDSDNRCRFVVEDGFLYFQFKAGGNSDNSLGIPYDATQHRFWRFRHQQMTEEIVFETSSNGVNWSVRRTIANPFPSTSLKIELNSGSYRQGGSLTATTAIFDNFKFESGSIPPPPSDDPDLPQLFVDTTYPTTNGATLHVPSQYPNIQSAIDAASPGSTIMIDPAGTYTPFTLRNKNTSSTQWIIIRSKSAAFDSTGSIPPGTRVDGAKDAHTSQMPKILSNANNVPAITADAGAHHYRLIGLEVGTTAQIAQDAMIQLGTRNETQTNNVPRYIIVDRCYVHGNDGAGSYRRGISLHGIHQAVIESHVSNYHEVGADTQAIWGSNGPGPFKIFNNYLEASGENVMFGGEDPSIPNLVPADIEIKRNHFTKRLSWRGDGGTTIKNLFELKNARRVLVDGNLFENCWSGQGQDFAILIKSSNQEGGCFHCVSEHVTFSNNIVRNIANAVDIGARDRPTGVTAPPAVNHVKIFNTLFYNVNSNWGQHSGRIFLIRGGANHIKIIHVTAEGRFKILYPDNAQESNPNLTFRDNIVERGAYGIQAASEGKTTLDANFSPYIYRKNLLVNTSDEPNSPDPSQAASDTTLLSRYPNPCTSPNVACTASDTFVASTWDHVGFVNRAGGDYRLASTSPFKGQASDGQDLGCNIDALPTAPPVNPIDDPQTFVRQHYVDFLNREPDEPGLDFWTDNITKCNDPARRPPGQTIEQCLDKQRVTTSAAFFLSPEFQYTGGYIYRIYRAALGRAPTFAEFMADMQPISQGIVANNQLQASVINQNRSSYASQFLQRPAFKAIYDNLNNGQDIDRLFQNTGVTPTEQEKSELLSLLNANPNNLATVLFKVADGTNIISEGNVQFTTTYGKAHFDKVFNQAFVTMEYFGYLRRTPDEAGYNFWLDKLNFYGNYLDAEMVRSFIVSPEYRARFGKPESSTSNSTTALMYVPLGGIDNAVWNNAVGVTVSGNSLTNTIEGWNTSGAVSTQAIISGNGYAECTITETNTSRMFGLSNGNSNQNYTDIDFAIYIAGDGNLYVYEAGNYRGGFGSYYPGDRLRVSVEDGRVRYRRNGALFYTSTVAPTYPLLIDTALYHYGSTISNAIIAGRLDHGIAAGSVSFFTGFESGQRQPNWYDSVDYLANVGGYCCGLTSTESSPRQEAARLGTTSLMYSGYDNSASGPSYSYNKVFDVNIAVKANTELSYWLYPQGVSGNNSAYVSIDLFCADGSSLRDSGAVDQWGVRLHPAFQGAGGRLSLNRWNLLRSKIGMWLAGKTIYRIYVAYDQPQNTGPYRGYIDDISIIDAAP